MQRISVENDEKIEGRVSRLGVVRRDGRTCSHTPVWCCSTRWGVLVSYSSFQFCILDYDHWYKVVMAYRVLDEVRYSVYIDSCFGIDLLNCV